MPQQQIRYQIPAQKDIAASSLTMTTEEPQPAIFFVRFEYDDGNADAEDEDEADAFYNEFRRSAYYEADIDTIRVIRQLAEEGRLDAPLV